MNIKLDLNDTKLMQGFKDYEMANITAVRNTLDMAAGMTRKKAIKNVERDFTLRNSFTKRQIQYQKVVQFTHDINNMQSEAGATAKAGYMETQEEGGKHWQKNPKPKAAVPMRSARVGGSEAKTVDLGFYWRKISKNIMRQRAMKMRVAGRPRRRRHFESKKALSVAQMFMAKKLSTAGKPKFIFRKYNIFSVQSIFKTGKNTVSAKLKHIYTIKPPGHIQKHAWLKPAYESVSRQLTGIYYSQLKKQWKTGPEKL